eukprot:scaffold96059_cov63-Phaeocystis_antarctica.AAC.1
MCTGVRKTSVAHQPAVCIPTHALQPAWNIPPQTKDCPSVCRPSPLRHAPQRRGTRHGGPAAAQALW